MTLDDAVKHQQVQDKRAIRSDTLEFLNQKYFSKSKQKHIRYGDMHLDHFFRVFIKKTQNDDLLGFLIKGFMDTLTQKGFAKKITAEEFLEEIQKEKKFN